MMCALLKEYEGKSGIPAVYPLKVQGTLLATDANWYLVFNSRNGNVYFMAKEGTGCASGWYGDLRHFISTERKYKHDELTELGKLILDKNIDTIEKYRKEVDENDIRSTACALELGLLAI